MGSRVNCGNFACDAGACLTSCTTDKDSPGATRVRFPREATPEAANNPSMAAATTRWAQSYLLAGACTRRRLPLKTFDPPELDHGHHRRRGRSEARRKRGDRGEGGSHEGEGLAPGEILAEPRKARSQRGEEYR